MASYGKLYAVTVVSSRVTFERPAEVDPKYTQMTKDPMRTLVSIECEVDKARCLVARMELGGVDRGMKLRASELSAGLFDDPEKLIKLSEKRWMVKGKFGGETEIDLTEGKVRLTMDDKEMHLRGEGKCVVGEPPSAR